MGVYVCARGWFWWLKWGGCARAYGKFWGKAERGLGGLVRVVRRREGVEAGWFWGKVGRDWLRLWGRF